MKPAPRREEVLEEQLVPVLARDHDAARPATLAAAAAVPRSRLQARGESVIEGRSVAIAPASDSSRSTPATR